MKKMNDRLSEFTKRFKALWLSKGRSRADFAEDAFTVMLEQYYRQLSKDIKLAHLPELFQWIDSEFKSTPGISEFGRAARTYEEKIIKPRKEEERPKQQSPGNAKAIFLQNLMVSRLWFIMGKDASLFAALYRIGVYLMNKQPGAQIALPEFWQKRLPPDMPDIENLDSGTFNTYKNALFGASTKVASTVPLLYQRRS